MENIVDILSERGLVADVTSPNIHDAVRKPVAVYAGFDPTAESLQVGNLVTIMALAHFQRCGHKVIALVGGATGMIGDPSGKTAERTLLTPDEVNRNTAAIQQDLAHFLDFDHPSAPASMVNNADWLGGFTVLDFLRDVGRHFRLGTMLGKESVRTRLNSETGMSFTEFSYQLLQAYDFLHLYRKEGCLMQIGGSDQWGNITAGIDLIHRMEGVEAFGLTIPLVTDSAGQKFGKSAGNAVYLKRNKTPVYDFYQFFIRITDDQVIDLLKIFTFLPMQEILDLETALRDNPEQRLAQKRLAEEVTRNVHGQRGLAIAEQASAVLFGKSMDGLEADDLLGIFVNVPSIELPLSAVQPCGALDLAVAAGLCQSKSQARRLIESGGLYINNRRVGGIEEPVPASSIIDGKLIVLRSGKKNFHLVKVVP